MMQIRGSQVRLTSFSHLLMISFATALIAVFRRQYRVGRRSKCFHIHLFICPRVHERNTDLTSTSLWLKFQQTYHRVVVPP